MRLNLGLSLTTNRRSAPPHALGSYVMRIQGSELVFAAAHDLRSDMRISAATAKDAGEAEKTLPLTAERVVRGASWGGWLGAGSRVERDFEDENRVVKFSIELTNSGFDITSIVTYKTDCNVEVEGFRFTRPSELFTLDGASAQASGDAVHAGLDGVFTDYGQLTPTSRFSGDVRNELVDHKRLTADSRTAKLNFDSTRPIIRPLFGPGGCESVFGIADHGHLMDTTAALEAVMYGTSDENDPQYGSKGWVGRGLKATFSVFSLPRGGGSRPRTLSNPESKALFDKLSATELVEIIPHTITPHAETRADVSEWLPVFEVDYGSRTWTDHNLLGGFNTAAIASRGWDATDETYYMLDLLEQHGIEYAWAYFDENVQGGIDQVFDGRWVHPPSYIAYPSQHVALPSGPLWLFKNSDRPVRMLVRDGLGAAGIDELVDRCGVSMGHTYIAAFDREGSNYVTGENGIAVITPEFDAVLAAVQSHVAAGRIWNPTMSEFMDRARLILSVSAERTETGFRLTNAGAEVPGCTFLITEPNATPTLNGVPMPVKAAVRGTIAWADLPPGDSTITL